MLFSYMKVLNSIGLDRRNCIVVELELAQTEKKNLLFDMAGNLSCICMLTALSIKTLGM